MTQRLEALAIELGLTRHVAKERCGQNCKLALPNVDNRLVIKADGVIVDKKACNRVVLYYTSMLNIVIVDLKISRINYRGSTKAHKN